MNTFFSQFKKPSVISAVLFLTAGLLFAGCSVAHPFATGFSGTRTTTSATDPMITPQPTPIDTTTSQSFAGGSNNSTANANKNTVQEEEQGISEKDGQNGQTSSQQIEEQSNTNDSSTSQSSSDTGSSDSGSSDSGSSSSSDD